MKWKMEAARWVLGKIPADRLSELAVQALQQGIETVSLIRLAALDHPIASDAGPLFEAALQELGELLPERDAAVWILVHEAANGISSEGMSPHDGARRLVRLGRELDPTPESLLVFVGLEAELDDFGDSTRIGYYGAEHCDRVRAEIRRRIIAEAASLTLGERAG